MTSAAHGSMASEAGSANVAPSAVQNFTGGETVEIERSISSIINHSAELGSFVGESIMAARKQTVAEVLKGSKAIVYLSEASVVPVQDQSRRVKEFCETYGCETVSTFRGDASGSDGPLLEAIGELAVGPCTYLLTCDASLFGEDGQFERVSKAMGRIGKQILILGPELNVELSKMPTMTEKKAMDREYRHSFPYDAEPNYVATTAVLFASIPMWAIRGFDVRTQFALMGDFCAKHGVSVVDEIEEKSSPYYDMAERRALQKAIGTVLMYGADYIMVLSPPFLTRNVKELELLIELFNSLQIPVRCLLYPNVHNMMLGGIFSILVGYEWLYEREQQKADSLTLLRKDGDSVD